MDTTLATPSSAFGTSSKDFLRAVGRRFSWRAVAYATGIGVPLLLAQQLPRIMMPSPRELRSLAVHPVHIPAWWVVVLVAAFSSLVMLVGVLAGDELVARGMGRFRAYASTLFVCGALGALPVTVPGQVFNIALGYSAGDGYTIWQPLVQGALVTGYAAFVTLIYLRWKALLTTQDERRAAELARSEVRRRALESNLQAMQARVEPEFLFGTLVRVRRLFEIRPEIAKAMLDDLVAYLRAALPHLRESSSTVDKETRLARAFFDIVKRRGQHVDIFLVDAKPDTLDARMPAMLVLPLMAAAIQASDVDDAGRRSTALRVRIEGDVLEIAIEHEAGTHDPERLRHAVSTTAQRLRALYDDAASLTIVHGSPTTSDLTRAVLRIPRDTADRGHR